MAETVHLYLKANGTDVQGDSTQMSLERADSIECVYYEDSVDTAREAGSGMATGRRRYNPIRIRKRIDKSSPLLYKALSENAAVDGVFKFFRPNPTGDGTTEMYYTIEFKKGRVAGMKTVSPDVIDPVSTNSPAMEEVSFVFGTICWTYTNGGITHEDSWEGNR
jgi:type VI secretion system secreted protein Hcp